MEGNLLPSKPTHFHVRFSQKHPEMSRIMSDKISEHGGPATWTQTMARRRGNSGGLLEWDANVEGPCP